MCSTLIINTVPCTYTYKGIERGRTMSTELPIFFFLFRILDPLLAGKNPAQIGEIKKEDFEDKQQFEWQSERMLITARKEASLM